MTGSGPTLLDNLLRTAHVAGREDVTLSCLPMNADFARAFGCVFKLAYTFPDPARPEVEIHVDTLRAQLLDWKIYGAPSRGDPAQVRRIAFHGPGAAQQVDLAGLRLGVVFLSKGERVFDVPKWGPTPVDCYRFAVLHLGDG